jgi:hypothetical protein
MTERRIQMKKNVMSLLVGFIALGFASSASAIPMDLSGFSVWESVPGSVTESGGTINFAENSTDAALYFYNDFYDVAANATTLSFDWDFVLGEFDIDDYLQFNVNYAEQWVANIDGTGHFEFDLTPYKGTTISLDWALIWGGDNDAGTTGSIYNIDVVSSGGASPVPEPATMILFGTGLAGAALARRRRKA